MTAHRKNITAHLFFFVYPEVKTYNFYTYTKYYYNNKFKKSWVLDTGTYTGG